ncbi:hypothetical protein KKB41_02255 [Patescibacteria group bacterium]|nr:hypothetical protein [Patescibacteria group bacterium]
MIRQFDKIVKKRYVKQKDPSKEDGLVNSRSSKKPRACPKLKILNQAKDNGLLQFFCRGCRHNVNFEVVKTHIDLYLECPECKYHYLVNDIQIYLLDLRLKEKKKAQFYASIG